MDESTTESTAAAHPSMDLLGDLEARLSALKQWQQEGAEQAAEVEKREAELAREREALAAEAAELAREREEAAAERRAIEEHQASAEARRRELDGQRVALEEESRALREAQGRAASDREAVATERAELEQERAALDGERERVEREGTELRERDAEAGATRERAAALEAQAAELAERAAAVEAEAAELDAQRASLVERASGLDAFAEELETELQRLNALEATLDERAAALDERERRLGEAGEAGGAAAAELDSLNARAASLSEELDARSAELERARGELLEAGNEVRRLRDAVAAAEEAAAEAAANPAAPAAAPAPGVDVQAMQAELDKRAHNLKRAKKKILDLQEQVRSASDMNGESAIFSSGEVDLGELTDLRMKLEQRDHALTAAGEKLAAREVEVQKLKARVDALLKSGGRAGSALPGDTPDHAKRAIELDELAASVTADRNRVLERKAQLKAADALIQSRREKIRGYIKDFRANHGRAKGAAAASVDPAKAAKLDQERKTLLEVKHFLQASEAQMVKRWALQKTATVAATLVIAVGVAAAVSWTAAGVIAQPLFQSTLTMEVRQDAEAEDLPPGVWLSGYGRDLFSDPVLQEVQNQLEQRNLRLAGSPEGLKGRLEGKLAVSGEPAALELTFTDPDPALVTPVLDAVGRGLLIHHMAQDRRAGRLSDTASLKSEAVRRDRPVEDERFRFFGMILGGFAALALLAAVPARFLAGRARPVLPEGGVPELAVLDHPSPLVAEAMEAARPPEDEEGDVIKPVFRF